MKKAWALVMALWMAGCGGSMHGEKLKNGFVEFKAPKTAILETGFEPNSIWLNIKDQLNLAGYEKNSLRLNHFDCRFETGTSPDFAVMNWNVRSLDGIRKLARVGRGLILFDHAKTKHMFLDMNFGDVDYWLWTDSEVKQAIYPMDYGKTRDMALNNDKAGLMLFKFNLSDWTQTRHRLSAWTETFSTPQFILLKNCTDDNKNETTSWSALNPDFADVKPPLVSLLNQFLSPFRDIVDIAVSKQGWGIFSHQAPDSLKTSLFLAWPGKQPVILPLYFGKGQGVEADLSRGRIVVSPSGDMFLAVGKSVKGDRFYAHDPESETRAAVFLGKIETVDGKPVPKIVHVADIPDISVSPSPLAWFPGSNGFAVLSGDLGRQDEIRFWIYSLDEHPVDWAKVPMALKAPKPPK